MMISYQELVRTFPNLFSGLLQNIGRHSEVLHAFGVYSHAVENAEMIGFIGDRNVRGIFMEAFSGDVAYVYPLLSQPLTADLSRIV